MGKESIIKIRMVTAAAVAAFVLAGIGACAAQITEPVASTGPTSATALTPTLDTAAVASASAAAARVSASSSAAEAARSAAEAEAARVAAESAAASSSTSSAAQAAAAQAADQAQAEAEAEQSIGATVAPVASIQSYVGYWESKFTRVTINPDNTGTFELAVPCCQHADFPITVVVNGDGSATGTVTGQATTDGGMNANLPIGSVIDLHFKPNREGEVLVVHNDMNPPGVNVTICGAGQTDSDCS